MAWGLTALLVLMWTGTFGITPALAQRSTRIEDSFAKTPCGRVGAPRPTAQERIAWRDIQNRINETIEADQTKDVETATFYDTPDFTVRNLDGAVEDLADVKKGIQEGYDNIYIVTDDTEIEIDCLVLKGREATVYINQHFVRTMPDRKDGSPHEVITNVTHRETWVYTDRGWMRKRIEELERGPSFLNGEPIEFD